MSERAIPACLPKLGAHVGAGGVHFSIYSSTAQGVELCLFDAAGAETRIALAGSSDGVWRAYVPNVRPGQFYGFRVYGPYVPQAGLRFNPAKLLLDPYARAMTGIVPADELLLGYDPLKPDVADPRDSAAAMPKCVVVSDAWDWGDDRPPRTTWSETIIYECHVKGLTKLHPLVPPQWRGTYLGLSSPPIIEHLLTLDITAVELMPVQAFVTEPRLAQMGLVNYWGYNTIGFFAPDVRYATAPHMAVAEFRTMVREFHQAGLEVILDVVYNHTAEGDERGSTLSFRGIDNSAYYHLDPQAPSRYANHTACGNTVNTLHPRAQQLIMDSLRYWVTQMHVDGFRFDLAPALCREPEGVDRHIRFFSAILQDPVLSQVKLLVEPWDAGPGGFCLGAFPPGVREWNGRYRDCVRRFWRGDAGQLAEFASRLAGSSDIFASRRTPLAGVNYITCHDGGTLHDLVTYARKHNEANGEENRDGPLDDFGGNGGVEGPTDDPMVLETRERMTRNLLATMAFSQGVPMLTAGDEISRTQLGNNNAYCQDNEISWVDWHLDETKAALLEFTRKVLSIRKANPALRRDAFFQGRLPVGLPDVVWLDDTGQELSEPQWRDPQRRCVMLMMREFDRIQAELLGGTYEGATWVSGSGVRNHLLLLINAGVRAQTFLLPMGVAWREVLYTGMREIEGDEVSVTIAERSLLLLASVGIHV